VIGQRIGSYTIVEKLGEGGRRALVTPMRMQIALGDEEGQLDSFPVVWVERDGTSRTLSADEGSYVSPRLSPDGSKLALSALRDDSWDLWVLDLERLVAGRSP
jgi:Tol biopolymer transport system component